jgi:hypothetical protein
MYGIRSERQLMEQLDYHLLYRWFVGLSPDDPVGFRRRLPRTRLEQGPDTGILQTNPAELPLIDRETVFRQSQPPHWAARTHVTAYLAKYCIVIF